MLVNLKANPGRVLFYGAIKQSSESLFELGTQYKKEWKAFYPEAE